MAGRPALAWFFERICRDLSNASFEFRINSQGSLVFREKQDDGDLTQIGISPRGAYDKLRDILSSLNPPEPPPEFQSCPDEVGPAALVSRPASKLSEWLIRFGIRTAQLQDFKKPQLARDDTGHLVKQFQNLQSWLAKQQESLQIICNKYAQVASEASQRPRYVIPEGQEARILVNEREVAVSVHTNGPAVLKVSPSPGVELQVSISEFNKPIDGGLLHPAWHGLFFMLASSGLTVEGLRPSLFQSLSPPKDSQKTR